MTAEVPRWIGQDLFGQRDDPISRMHPVVLCDAISQIHEASRYPNVAFNIAVSRAHTIRERRGGSVFFLRHPLLEQPGYPLPAPGLDLEGPYMVQTRHLAGHRDFLRSLAVPVPALQEGLEAAWQSLRDRGDAVIGVHVRRGDFERVFCQQGFEFIAPLQWYMSWLEQVWRQFNHPVLFLASDSLEQVLPAFGRYRPVTILDLKVKLPPDLLHLDLPPSHILRDATFFPDWFMLTRCHALAISNSAFSFSASTMNQAASVFVRPDLRSKALVPFDPWDSEPLLYLPQAGNLPLAVLQRLFLAQQGMGTRTTAWNLRRALRWYVWVLTQRARTARQFLGPSGLSRELLRPQFYLAIRRRYDEPAASPEAEIPRAQMPPLSSRP